MIECSKNACICDITMFIKCHTQVTHWCTRPCSSLFTLCREIQTKTKTKTEDNSILWSQNKYLDCISVWFECFCGFPCRAVPCHTCTTFILFLWRIFPFAYIQQTRKQYKPKYGFTFHFGETAWHCEKKWVYVDSMMVNWISLHISFCPPSLFPSVFPL